jgi:hypothetical protein
VFTLGADAEKKGVAIRGGGKGCEYVAICEGEASEFAETFLGCRELVRSATCAEITGGGCHSHASALGEIPTPDFMDGLNILDGSGALSAAKASRISLMKGMFALLDGRSSCPGVHEEVKRMSENLRRRGCVHQAATLDALGKLLSDPEDASMLRRFAKGTSGNLKRLLEAIALEASGSVVSAGQVYARLANGSDGFFAALRLARLRMDEDDVDGAIEVLARTKGKRESNLLAAPDLGLARAYSDRAAAAKIAASFDGEMCGESGALAAYEMGRIVAAEDPKAARRYFEMALDADSGLAPAYPALGRAMVSSGVSASRASELLLKWLTRAPPSREIVEMRGRLAEYLAKLSRGPVDLISHP